MAHHLLAIGVNHSVRDRNIRPLAFAVADARAFHEFCAEDLGYGDNAVLVAEPASFHSNVRAAIDQIGRRAVSGDTFVLYFAGHGYVLNGDSYCLLSNAELRTLKAGRTDMNDLLSIGWLRKEVRDTWADGVHMACILDACRTEIKAGTRSIAGMAEQRKQLEGYVARGDFSYQRQAAGGRDQPEQGAVGDIELYACPTGEESHEFAPIQRGLVSYALQNWLREGQERGEPRILDESLPAVLERSVDLVAREHRSASPGQRPVVLRHGAAVVLFQPDPRQRLSRSQEDSIRQFNTHLGAGRLEQPFGQCARDTLTVLRGLGLPDTLLLELTEQLQQARQKTVDDADAAHDENLVKRASQRNTKDAWSRVEFDARLPATRELALRRMAELEVPPPPPPPPPPQDPAEHAAQALGNSPTAEQCRDFLARFGHSTAADSIQQRLVTLDDQAWNQAVTQRTESAVLRYLAEWANGRHNQLASAALLGIRSDLAAQEQANRDAEEASRKAKQAQEDADWATAKEVHSISGYQGFLSKWNEGRYAAQAQTQIRDIRAAETAAETAAEEARRVERQQREAADWQQAQQVNTVVAFQTFCTQWPASPHHAQAQSLIAQLQQAEDDAKDEAQRWKALQLLTPRTPAQIQAALAKAEHLLERHPQTRHKVAVRGLIQKWEALVIPEPPPPLPPPDPGGGVITKGPAKPMQLALAGLAAVAVLAGIAVMLAPGNNAASDAQPSAAALNPLSTPAAAPAPIPGAIPTAAPAPDPQALRTAYLQARTPLLADPSWAVNLKNDRSTLPAALLPVLEQATVAAQAGVPEAQFDLGQAMVYGQGMPRSETAGVENLFRWLATPGATGNAGNNTRAITAVDHGMGSAIRRGEGATWAAPLVALAAVNHPSLPVAFWQGVLQRCLVRPLDKPAATRALTVAKETPDTVGPDAKIYRDLAARHLACMEAGMPCGPACTL